MEKEKYDLEVKIWNDWNQKQQDYLEKRKEIIQTVKDEDEQDKLLKKLDKVTGFGELDTFFGPTTFIMDKEDLTNPDFIMPGMGRAFKDLPGREEIPGLWGKTIQDQYDTSKVGPMVGYAYDYTDDYIVISVGDKLELILINTYYIVLEE